MTKVKSVHPLEVKPIPRCDNCGIAIGGAYVISGYNWVNREKVRITKVHQRLEQHVYRFAGHNLCSHCQWNCQYNGFIWHYSSNSTHCLICEDERYTLYHCPMGSFLSLLGKGFDSAHIIKIVKKKGRCISDNGN